MMTKEQIGKIISPEHPYVYAPTLTNERTKLIFEDGTILIGYFQPTDISGNLEHENKYTFILLSDAQKYRDTQDNKFVTIVSGNDLLHVEHPSYPS